MSILLGAIADDFTGATDLANTLVKEGIRVTQVIGIPSDSTEIDDAQAVVVALKSRTNPVDEAVDWSIKSLRWLKEKGAEQFFFKYCSTFDSTGEGNIGPVANALMDELKSDFAFVCPAFPGNGRTIFQGYLFVGDKLLSESSMKDHPLTPMKDSNLLRLMSKQSRRKVGLINLDTVRRGEKSMQQAIELLRSNQVCYAIVDAVDDENLRKIGHAAIDHKLITGGSALAMGIPDNFRRQGKLDAAEEPDFPKMKGGSIALAGSCSLATHRQIEYVKSKWPCRKIDVDDIASGKNVTVDLVSWCNAQATDTPVLIYSSSDPNEVAAIQESYGVQQSAEMVEHVMGEIAIGVVSKGFDRLVVAGGETSGAVVSALGIRALRVGPEIDPGVPWTESLGDPSLALALKSGNFGTQDFFEKAFTVLS